MSVLVSSLTNHHHHHHHLSSTFFSTNTKTNRRSNGSHSMTTSNQSMSMKSNENEQDGDHVPFGMVNSMKQRFLNKVNESYLVNHNSSLPRSSTTKPSVRLPSNENHQPKPLPSPLKRTTRLSRSQDNLSNNNHHPSIPSVLVEPLTSYLQPKHDVIIVESTTNSNNYIPENDDDVDVTMNEKLRPTHKTSAHRQSYTELHRDEAPKPGTVTTVKKMFERQIRLSRYDADKLLTTITPAGSRMNSQHRDYSSPNRSRSMSPNDMAVRQKRTNHSGPILPSTSPSLSLPVPTSYPDLVISHTPPTDPTKSSFEPALINTHTDTVPLSNLGTNKEKKPFVLSRSIISSDQHSPLTVIVDEIPNSSFHHQRPNLLLPSKPSETIESQPLDFKSRLALFNRNNFQISNENSILTKKSPIGTNSFLTKPTTSYQPARPIIEEKKENQTDPFDHHLLPATVSRSVVNTAKAVTFFGGSVLNGNSKSSLSNSFSASTPPPLTNSKSESIPIDIFRAPDIVGGNIKLTKSSIFSGSKKDTRVQFIEYVDTFEYPSFEVAMAELGNTGSDDETNLMRNNDDDEDDEDDDDDDDEDDDEHSNARSRNNDDHIQLKNIIHDKLVELTNIQDDVDDDELERLARINAKFNSSNSNDKSLKPKGTLHTFRPTHLDQYELGTQHDSVSSNKSSDKPFSILARQKLIASSDSTVKNLNRPSIIKQQQQQQQQGKSNFDLTNNIQWSSMSTTTDLLF